MTFDERKQYVRQCRAKQLSKLGAIIRDARVMWWWDTHTNYLGRQVVRWSFEKPYVAVKVPDGCRGRHRNVELRSGRWY